MTDLLDELQRLHDAVGKKRSAAIADERRLAGYTFARFNLANAAEKHLPALLRVARAAAEIERNEPSTADPCVRELYAALAELRGTT